MYISIIIPTLNEEKYIDRLIHYLRTDPSFALVAEIIVVDGNSDDSTAEIAEKAHAKVLVCSIRNRAHQMNSGAHHAKGQVLYFLHADTIPPTGYAQKIWDSVQEDKTGGCFRLRFDWSHWFLNASSWFTRFKLRFFRFGDQSLFIKKETFVRIKGFNEELNLFEDQEIIKRLYALGSFVVIPDYVITSARKYRKNGPFRLQLVYFWIYLLFVLGLPQKALIRNYQKLVPFPMI